MGINTGEGGGWVVEGMGGEGRGGGEGGGGSGGSGGRRRGEGRGEGGGGGEGRKGGVQGREIKINIGSNLSGDRGSEGSILHVWWCIFSLVKV